MMLDKTPRGKLFTAKAATTHPDKGKRTFSKEALKSMAAQAAGKYVTRLFDRSKLVGLIKGAHLDEGGDLVVDVFIAGPTIPNLDQTPYIIPGGKLVKSHREGDIQIADEIDLIEFSLVDIPSDSNVTKLQPKESDGSVSYPGRCPVCSGLLVVIAGEVQKIQDIGNGRIFAIDSNPGAEKLQCQDHPEHFEIKRLMYELIWDKFHAGKADGDALLQMLRDNNLRKEALG